MSKLKDRAATIDLSHIARVRRPDTPPATEDSSATPQPPASDTAQDAGQTPSPSGVRPANAPRTAVGAFTASLQNSRELERQIVDLREQLKKYDGAKLVEILDPRTIRPSAFANRHEDSYKNEDFLLLKEEIQNAGFNVQPIKVRALPGTRDADALAQSTEASPAVVYEIIYGHRRHRACLELGLPVSAVLEDMDDRHLFIEMERENRTRANLSIYEQGLMYKRALDSGLYNSLGSLSRDIGVNIGTISTAVAIVNLPVEIIKAFNTPIDIQYRWAWKLQRAWKNNEDHVRMVYQEILELAAEGSRPTPQEIFSRLTKLPSKKAKTEPRLFERDGRTVAQWERNARGGIALRIEAGVLSHTQELALQQALDKLLG